MPAMASKTITTKRGDTLHGLARKYGVWPIDIAKANNLPAGSNIKDGVRLTIPDPPATVWIRPTLDRLSVVNSDRIMVRLGPGSQYRRTTLLDSGSVVRVTAKQGVWCQVSAGPEIKGWIRGDLLSAPSGSLLAAARARAAAKSGETRRVASATSTRSKRSPSRTHVAKARVRSYAVSGRAPAVRRTRDVVRTALAYRGAPYRYGGAGRRGFDCSGFTSHVYAGKGVALPHSSAAQFSKGQRVTKGTMKPGDLVFFGRGRRGINHVGIYMGGDRFVHAARPGKGVRVDSLSSSYYKSNFKGARRIAR